MKKKTMVKLISKGETSREMLLIINALVIAGYLH